MDEGRLIELRRPGLSSTAVHTDPLRDDAPVVLCLHGFPDHRRTFRALLPDLEGAGYHAVAPTLRGYEPCSQPYSHDYTLSTLTDDVLAWLDHLKAPSAHLIGHDWGAVIGYAAAARFPERISSLTALAVPPIGRLAQALPALPSQIIRSSYMLGFRLPTASHLLQCRSGWAVQKLWRLWSPSYRLDPGDWELLRADLCAPGVLASALAYYRQNIHLHQLLPGPNQAWRAYRKINVPTLIIHGREDGCMDPRLFAHAYHREDFSQESQLVPMERAGHFLHLERPDAINALILSWLREQAR